MKVGTNTRLEVRHLHEEGSTDSTGLYKVSEAEERGVV